VRLNPLRAIPVLERDDGEVFFDSPMICEYIDSLNDKPRLYPASGEARWQALRWHALGQGMMEATVARFVELRKPARSRMRRTPPKHEARIAAALAFAAERVPASGFISGNTIGIADITLAAALGYIDLRYAHDWRGRHPRLAQWLVPISARPSFIEPSRRSHNKGRYKKGRYKWQEARFKELQHAPSSIAGQARAPRFFLVSCNFSLYLNL